MTYQNHPLPLYIKNQINAAQTGTSGRSTLEGHIRHLKTEQHAVEIEALYALQNDSARIGTDSIIKFINYLGGGDAAIKRFKLFLAYGDTLKANAEMASINILTSGTALGDYLKKLSQIFTKYKEGSVGMISDTTAAAAITAMRADFTQAESKGAEGLSQLKEGNVYREWIQGRNNSVSRMATTQEADASEIKNTVSNVFSVFPNPSNGVFNYMFTNTTDEEGVIMTVYDITGKSILEKPLDQTNFTGKIDLSSYADGMYFVIVSTPTKILYSNKISCIN